MKQWLTERQTPDSAAGGAWRWTTGNALLHLTSATYETTLKLHIHAWARYWRSSP
jgi:hypothetical protein